MKRKQFKAEQSREKRSRMEHVSMTEQSIEKRSRTTTDWNLLFGSRDIMNEIVSYMKPDSRYFLSCVSHEFADIVYYYIILSGKILTTSSGAPDGVRSRNRLIINNAGIFGRLNSVCPDDMRADMLLSLSRCNLSTGFDVIIYMLNHGCMQQPHPFEISYNCFSAFVKKCVDLSLDGYLKRILDIKGYYSYIGFTEDEMNDRMSELITKCIILDRHACANVLLKYFFGSTIQRNLSSRIRVSRDELTMLWLRKAAKHNSGHTLTVIMDECHGYVSIDDIAKFFKECCLESDISTVRAFVESKSFTCRYVFRSTLEALLLRRMEKHLDLLKEYKLLAIAVPPMMDSFEENLIQYLIDGHWADGIMIPLDFTIRMTKNLTLAYQLYDRRILEVTQPFVRELKEDGVDGFVDLVNKKRTEHYPHLASLKNAKDYDSLCRLYSLLSSAV